MEQHTSRDLLEQIKAVWQTDSQYVEDFEGGFYWWPGHHRVSVRCAPKDDPTDPHAWRVSVVTEFLKDVNLEDSRFTELMISMGSFAPTYGWVHAPPEIAKKYIQPQDGKVAFYSTTYIRPESANWLPGFFARLAIMQPIDAQRTADPVAELLQGEANKSGVRHSTGTSEIDDILNVAHGVFAPKGKEPSKWIGSSEFSDIAERYGSSDLSFGTGGPDGLTLETPFCKSSSLIRLHHDINHPALGSGLLATIRLPVFETKEASNTTCVWLNYLASTTWTDAPTHGSWHPQEIRKGEFAPTYGMFVPNALYENGIATNVTLWNLMLARWARLTLWPDLLDDTMLNILNARMQQLEEVAAR